MIHKIDLRKTLAFLSLVILAWCLQGQFLINWDFSWDLLVTQRLLSSGTYSHDFFELNPPLIFFIYAPGVWLADFFSWPLDLTLRGYLFFLMGLTLALDAALLRNIFQTAQMLRTIFLCVLICVLLILPGTDFGEREQLLITFSMPYFLYASVISQGRTCPCWQAVIIGICAFLGFALKPYFFCAYVLVEIYILYSQKRLSSLIRTSSLTLLSLTIFYVAIIVLFYPDYISKVVPLAMRFYYTGFNNTWEDLLFHLPVIFLSLSFGLYAWCYNTTSYRDMCNIFCLACIGFFISYLIQHTDWFYHILPAFSMALLICTLLCSEITLKHPRRIISQIVLIVAIFMIPFSVLKNNYNCGNQYKRSQQPLIQFLQRYAFQQPVYFISASPREIFPAVSYAGAKYASRLLHLFWLPGVVKEHAAQYPHNKSSILAPKHPEENIFINMVAEDIAVQKPRYIFVDVKEYKAFYDRLSFDYLPYLLQNENFKTAWQPYHFFSMLEKHFISHTPSPWKLYLAQQYTDVDPTQIDESTVVLSGQGKQRIAYFIKQQHWLKKNGRLIVMHLVLTNQELLQLAQKSGKIITDEHNTRLVTNLLHRAILPPIYQYAIFERNHTE